MTQTTNLGITLLEQSQSQKEVTINEAFQTIDGQFGGVAIVTVSDGANSVSDPAVYRNGGLTFTGSLTATAQVYLPGITKAWVIINDTGETLEFQGEESGSSEVVSVPAGQSDLLFSDGVDIKRAGDSDPAGAVTHPYDLSINLPGKPSADEYLLRVPMVRAVTMPINLTGSAAVCRVAPVAAVSFDIEKNGVPIGTVNFAGAATVGSFTFASEVSFAAADVFSIVAPSLSALDDTIEDIGISIKCTEV